LRKCFQIAKLIYAKSATIWNQPTSTTTTNVTPTFEVIKMSEFEKIMQRLETALSGVSYVENDMTDDQIDLIWRIEKIVFDREVPTQ